MSIPGRRLPHLEGVNFQNHETISTHLLPLPLDFFFPSHTSPFLSAMVS